MPWKGIIVAARILQLTDLHLFCDRETRLKNVPTLLSFLDVWEVLKASLDSFDQIIVTGDLTHDERLETYESLRELLQPVLARCRMIPGNHDHRGHMRQVFPELVAADGDTSGSHPLTFSTDCQGWRLIGLDSQIPAEVAGRIEAGQLEWLRAELANHSGQPTMLFMHHPPISVDSEWLDRIGLQDAQAFQDLVCASHQVRAVCAGHVHHEFQGRLGQAEVLTSPSTAIQFLPASDDPVYELVAPGFRMIELDGDSYRTNVARLPSVKYPPEMPAS